MVPPTPVAHSLGLTVGWQELFASVFQPHLGIWPERAMVSKLDANDLRIRTLNRPHGTRIVDEESSLLELRLERFDELGNGAANAKKRTL